MEISEQLKKIRTQKNMTQAEFASFLGVSTASIASIENGSRDMPKSVMKTLVTKLGVNANWLITGEGPVFITGEDTLPCQQTKIPLLRQRVSCGPGQNWEESDSVESYIEPLSLVPSMQGKKVCAFRVRGTSMVGAGINDGDVILFNSETEEVLNDDIYVFALEGNVYCKLLKFDEISRKIEIYSLHSPKMEDAELLRTLDANSPESAETFHLFGRVLAWIRENKICWR